jgi:hypothetical protein
MTVRTLRFLSLLLFVAFGAGARAMILPADTAETVSPAIAPAVDTVRTDSIATPRARPLLPDNMSFMERGLWCDHGLLRSVGIASSLTPDVRKHELSIRRTMLSIHQIGGFVTLGLMGATVYFGQQVLNGHYELLPRHKSFVAATIISYSATAMLAVFSPPPFIRRNEVSTTTIHKTLAWIHFAGMIATPILGRLIAGGGDYNRRAHFHQVAAYITTAALAASMIIITF